MAAPAMWIVMLVHYISTGTFLAPEVPLANGWQAIFGLCFFFVICFSFPYLYLKRRREHKLKSSEPKDEGNWIVNDHLRNARMIVDSRTGRVMQALDYGEFEIVTQDTNPSFQPFGFAAGEYAFNVRCKVRIWLQTTASGADSIFKARIHSLRRPGCCFIFSIAFSKSRWALWP